MKLIIVTFFIILFSILDSFATFVSSAKGCHAEDYSFSSNILPEQDHKKWIVNYRVFFPSNYTPNKKYSVVYFLHGRNGNRFLLDNLDYCSKVDALSEHVDNSFITIAPDGENSYWMNGALTNLRWGDVVTTELINEVENKFSVYRSSEGRLIAGISMGGHGAIQLTLNNPGIYGAVAAHSPVFRTQEEASRDFYFEFGTGLDYLNRDPFSLMMILGKTIIVPVWIDMGGADPWLRNTQNFANYISSKKLPASLHVAEDALSGHDFDYWRFHLSSYLEWYSKQLKKTSDILITN